MCFYLVSFGSLWRHMRSGHKMPFQMTWWSLVFPNMGLVIATEAMGDKPKSNGLHLFAAIVTVILSIVRVDIFVKVQFMEQTVSLARGRCLVHRVPEPVTPSS
ncbi:hypothetical protein J3458_021927 [Metarhizium acridum]|uniref:uncharacterized protein n=1 Tax=Metarhizium acridum TaxID=92637 RepID=UPI001C6CD9B5|nr:hypothetical protein J3458_021927 [Metarhizium acridum]